MSKFSGDQAGNKNTCNINGISKTVSFYDELDQQLNHNIKLALANIRETDQTDCDLIPFLLGITEDTYFNLRKKNKDYDCSYMSENDFGKLQADLILKHLSPEEKESVQSRLGKSSDMMARLSVVSSYFLKKNPSFTNILARQAKSMQMTNLLEVSKRFNGFCELICNYAIQNHSLSNPAWSPLMLTPAELNENVIRRSHIAHIFPLMFRLFSMLSHLYPYARLNRNEHKLLLQRESNRTTVNPDILQKAFHNDSPVKIILFSLDISSGHTMLAQREENNTYTLLDPPEPCHRGLNIKQLTAKINKAIESAKTTRIALIDGRQYMDHVSNKQSFFRALPRMVCGFNRQEKPTSA